jgi:hypothetical protein
MWTLPAQSRAAGCYAIQVGDATRESLLCSELDPC